MKKYLQKFVSVFMFGIFSLSSVFSYGLVSSAVEFSILQFDISGEISFVDELSRTSAEVVINVTGKDAAKVQKIALSDGQEADFLVDDGETKFSVKDNGEYSAKLILLGGEEVEIDQTVTVNCIDRAAPVVKSAEYDDRLISDGNLSLRVYVSEYVTRDCNKSYGKITRVYLTNSKGEKVSETNTQKDGCYTLEVEKNGTYLVYAEDLAGNISTSYTVKVDVIDRDAPEINVTSVDYFEDDESFYEIKFNVEGNDLDKIIVTAAEDNSKIPFKKDIDGYSFNVNKNGNYNIFASDKAGNETLVLVEVELKDKVAPKITFDEYDKELLGKETITINYKITDQGGFTFIYINGESVSDFNKEDTEYLGTYELAVGKTFEVMAYDTEGNVAYDSIKNAGGDALLPVINSLEVTDITDNSAKAKITLENSDGMKIRWYILEPDGKWSKLGGESEVIDIRGLKRHSDYTVKAEVTNIDGAVDNETASFKTLSMGTLSEEDDAWLLYVAIGVVSCLVIAFTIFIIIFIKNGKGNDEEEEEYEYEDEE